MKVQRVMRASPQAYVAVSGLSGLVIFILLVTSADRPYAVLVRAFSLALLATVLAWLRAFRVTLDAQGMEFRSLFGGLQRIAWDDIYDVRVSLEFSHPLRGPLRLTVTPRAETGLQPFGVNAKVFDSANVRLVIECWREMQASRA